MYKDFTGKILVDTVDHFASLEEYAKNFGIDTNTYSVLGIEMNRLHLSDDETCYFIVQKSSKPGEELKILFEPSESLFRTLFKRTQIIIRK